MQQKLLFISFVNFADKIKEKIMVHILNIDTSTEVCSVSIANDEKIIFSKTETKGPSHASILGVFVAEAISFLRSANKQLDAVAVSSGPGSYTGLRIGVSEAKGLCYGFNIPLIAIDSLKIMATGFVLKEKPDNHTLLCPMIDARRMEVYAAIYDNELNIVREIGADIVDNETYKSFLTNKKIIFFGNGALKCRSVINSPNAIFVDNVSPLASDMISLSLEAYTNKQFEDIAYFEPFYLKEFVATTPKNKIF